MLLIIRLRQTIGRHRVHYGLAELNISNLLYTLLGTPTRLLHARYDTLAKIGYSKSKCH